MKTRKDPARVEHARRAEGKAEALLDAIKHLDRIPAEKAVRRLRPDVETIVGLAFLRQRRAATARHAPSERIKQLVLKRWDAGDFKTKSECAEWAFKEHEIERTTALNWLYKDRPGPRK